MSFWLDRPVLVTGGSGLLGSWLVRELLDRKASVGVLLRDHVPRSRLLEDRLAERCWRVSGDVVDFDLLERALNEYEVDTVFHLAAQTLVPIANRNPRSTFDTNIRGTYELLEACRRAPTVKRIIVASSDKAYGDQGTDPYDESQALQGRHPYDVSKSCADLIAQSYFHTWKLPVCVTRLGNLYGGGDLNYNRLVPGTIRSALRGERPIVRSDGLFVRDYFYVHDGALAYLLLAEQMLEKGVAGEAFNFSSHQPHTVLQMVDKILAACGRTDLEPVVLNEAQHEIHTQVLASAKARRLLGWEPRYSVEQALGETVAWYRQHLE